MNDEKRKSHMISLRVSEEEYAILKQIYRVHGAHSVSDFARISMQRVTALEDKFGPGVLQRIENIDARVAALELRLLSLMERHMAAE